MEDSLYIGLMSGTSVDAIDSALVRCTGENVQLLATHQHAIPADIRDQIAALSHAGDNEIERMGPLDRELGRLFAAAVQALTGAAEVSPQHIRAIGSHGQTVRHRPPSGGSGAGSFTLQLGDPNTIAEITGITTVADFRRRDIAAGGEGAPLAPAFHCAALSREGINRAIVNIGGIANISLLKGNELIAGFDSGPGNTLLDHWVQRHLGKRYDQDGKWSQKGKVIGSLLTELLQHPYFALSGPRSTGKEDFHLAWLDGKLKSLPALDPCDVQATLAELTATSIARAIEESVLTVTELYVCGGGAHNPDLMHRLARLMPPIMPATTDDLGVAPDWVEAVTFAWLAHRTVEALAGNAPTVTGASGPRVLGGVFTA